MDYPQEKREQLAAYFRQLRRKGIRSVYFPPGYVTEAEATYEPAADGGETEMPAPTKKKNTLAALERTVSGCIACPLHESRTQTVFGVGKVAQFTTHSYPHIGFGLMVVHSVLVVIAANRRYRSLKGK